MPGQIIPRGRNVWLVRIYLGRDGSGKRVYQNKTIHGNKKDAQAYSADALRQRDLGGTDAAFQKTLTGELLDDVLTDYKVNGKDYDWAERKIRLHLRPAFGALPARRLTTALIQQHISARLDAGAANATINRELAILKRALNLGRKHTPPKVTRFPHIPMLDENNVRKGFFEHEEFLRMKAALPEEIRPVLVFAYYTGCRKGEILSLQWSQVNLKERVVRLDPGTTKNDEPRAIPLTAELLEVLEAQKALRGRKHPKCDYVFFRDGEEIEDFRGSWEEACYRANLWEGDRKTGKPTKLFHDLRRTGVRNLIRAGVPERIAMAISRHKTRSVFDRYNIVSEADLQEAATKLNSYFTEKSALHLDNSHTICTQTDQTKNS